MIANASEPPSPDASHAPVLLAEVLAALTPADGERIVDGTFGAGGYTRAVLGAAETRVLAIDRDPAAGPRAEKLAAEVGPRLVFRAGCFGDLDQIAREAGFDQVQGVVLDVGVSSMQLDEPQRGFSFQADGPLDMRMSGTGQSAADLVNTLKEQELAAILYELGEERRSRAIARTIVAARPITTTLELARLVSRVLGGRSEEGRHPATRTFQALRIAVNDELGELQRALAAAERILSPGGRLVVVSFHSLEDRIVKRFLLERSDRAPRGSRHAPEEPVKLQGPSFRIVNPKPLTPSQPELDLNPRSRSARLRAAVRTEAAAWREQP
jgi:16S rRNA (cytosine1402-N4)-methyltransferase